MFVVAIVFSAVLQRTVSFLAAVVFAGAASAAEPLAMAELAPGVYVHQGAIEEPAPANGGDIANTGFVVGSRCVAVIDTGGSPQVGERLRAAVARVTALPVCFVINTHAHPDHLFGNGAFASLQPAPALVVHARYPAAFAARERYFVAAMQRELGVAIEAGALPRPGQTVDGRTELDLGERKLLLKAWPTAHTDNDLTVLDERTRTLFAGDLLFAGHLPVLDGKLRGWLAVMDELAQLDAALVVPGHGAPVRGGPGAYAAQRAYLEALLNETRAAIKSGQTIRAAVERVGIEAAKPWQLVEAFHRRNVTAAYAELEWE